MRPRRIVALLVAAVVLGAGAATALAATADSITVDMSNSKSLKRLALFADVAECDDTGGYDCYTASVSIYAAGGRRILRRELTFDADGHVTYRYGWSCKYTGLLQWRVRVSDGTTSATRRARFRVSRC